MFGKKCMICDTEVGGLFGKKNSGTAEKIICFTCADKELREKEHQRELELSAPGPPYDLIKSGEINLMLPVIHKTRIK